jgi:hypothetical protein
MVIAEVRRVAATHQTEFVTALEGRWRNDELTRRIRDALLSEETPDPATNIWRWVTVEAEGEWLVTQHRVGSCAVTVNNAEQRADLFHLQIFPAALVSKAIRNATTQSGIWIPQYASVAVQLGGRGVDVNSGSLHPPFAKLAYPLLAESDPGAVRMRAPVLEYPLSVQIHLAQPEQLFAQHRQRTMLTGALLLGVALVATLGLVAAWRSFQKQLLLNEMKSNFVSSVSHELRAPIASVRLLAESLERGKISEPAKQNEYFRFIGQECRRLSALIENVLDFSRIEQGPQTIRVRADQPGALVEQTVKLMQPYAEERGVKLKPEVEVEVRNSNVDGRAIQQALVNLIDNAIKHSPKETMLVKKTGQGTCLERGPWGSRRANLQPSTFNLQPLRHRPRPGHSGVRTRKDFRAVLPARLGVAARDAGRGDWIEHRETRRRSPWRSRARGKRSWQRQPVHD